LSQEKRSLALNTGPVLCYVSRSFARDRGRAIDERLSGRVPVLRAIEFEEARVGRRRAAVVEIRKHLAGLYRGFVWWTSLHGEVDDDYERENRERVVELLEELSNQYLPRSVWLTEGSRKKVENFVRKSEELCSEFSAEIEARGYPRVRRSMERRVSKQLRPLKTEAESGLQAELAQPRPGWRERLRMPQRA
jgi:hypothetical protein